MFRTKAGVPSRAARRAKAPRAGRGSCRRRVTLGLPLIWGVVALAYEYGCPVAQQNGLGSRVVTSVVFFAVGSGLVLQLRHSLLQELRRIHEVAGAAQRVLLRPLPSRIDGIALAAAQLSADRAADVGGDLYEAVSTDHGVRIVMGDVRGHGLTAIGTVATVLGSFREAAHDEPGLPGLLRRLERALDRDLRRRSRAEHPASAATEPDHPVSEEFVTLLLLEIRPDGEIVALNCGHPWPLSLRGRIEPLAPGDPLPPLGCFPLPPDPVVHHCGQLLPGDALLLYTDGLEDARNGAGRFFPLRDALMAAVSDQSLAPHAVIGAVRRALLRHVGGPPTDDVALLVLRNDRARTVPPAEEARDPCAQVPTAG